MKTSYLSIFIILLLNVSSFAQTKKAFIKEAEKAYAEKNYHGALVYFDEALKFDKKDGSLIYKTAEAARQYNAYGYAVSKYRYLLDTLNNTDYNDVAYRLGEMYQKLGEYDLSSTYYRLYLSEYSNQNSELTAMARRNLASVTKAKKLIEETDHAVTIERMSDEINSPDADFAAIDVNGDMYFSSMKYYAKSKDLRYKQIAKTLKKSKGGIGAMVVDGYVNDRDLSVAHFAFNTDKTKVFYSICGYVNGWSQSCQIYRSDVDKNGNLSNEIKLPSSINADNSSNTQPSVGKTKSGKEILYFVSDREGGKGGRDIYSSTFEGDSFDAVVNLEAINTSEDEISPFYHQNTHTLYWSTEGREGFGGFDIFSLEQNATTPKILPAPYNSSMNDMFYFMDESGSNGYLTSNRSGSAIQYESYEACCMDIYSFKRENDIKLDVLTLLASERSALNGTRICLIDADTNTEIECINNDERNNKHSFTVKSGKNYKLIATKDGFNTATETFKTLPTDGALIKELLLSPATIRLDVFTYERPTNIELIGTKVRLIDVTTGVVQVAELTNNNTNEFVFNILPGRNYKLEATKDEYNTAIETFSTEGISGIMRKDMYLQRATLQELLPISLYFDNDYPNPRSNQPTTNSQYIALANDYLLRKNTYITNFIEPLNGSEKEMAQREIEVFFENDVKKGKENFEAFLIQLSKRLNMGEKIELEVRGFASPRSKREYNKILSERRINSIKNEMKNFNKGILKRFIDNGSLKLKDVSYGDKTAKPNVVSDLNDERNSIYNINAAKERRVEILKVNIK